MLYTTPSVLQERLWLENLSDDESLSLIQRSTNIIDAEIGGNIGLQERTERCSGSWGNRLYVKYPISSIIDIITPDDRSISEDFFEWYIIHLKESTNSGIKNYTVHYESWFSEIPSDLEEICIAICASILHTQGEKCPKVSAYVADNIKSKKIDSLSVTYRSQSDMQKSAFDKLAPSLNPYHVLRKYKAFSWIII